MLRKVFKQISKYISIIYLRPSRPPCQDGFDFTTKTNEQQKRNTENMISYIIDKDVHNCVFLNFSAKKKKKVSPTNF